MTDYTIIHTVDNQARNVGLARATAAYNATLPADVTQMTEAQYLTFIAGPEINRWLDSYAAQYTVRTVTRAEFLMRFPPAARITIREMAKTMPELADYMALLDAAASVELDHADTIGGINALVAVGLLTPEQGAAILEM